MLRKYGKPLIFLLVLGLVYGGWILYRDDTKFVAKLSESNRDSVRLSYIYTRQLADQLAVLPVTADPGLKQRLLREVYRSSFQLGSTWNRNLWTLFGHDYPATVYFNIHTLSDNLLDKDLTQPFSEEELKNLKLAENYLREVDAGLSDILALKLTDRQWANITAHPGAKKIASKVVDRLNSLPRLEVKGKSGKYVEPIKGYTGNKVSVAEAVKVAERFIGPELANKYDFAQGGGGGDQLGNEYYVISPHVKGTNRLAADIRIEVSAQGGHLIRYSTDSAEGNQRKFDKPTIGLKEAEQIAREYLKRWEADIPMALIKAEQRGSVAYLTFGANFGGILVYHDEVRMSVALDNGELRDFDAWLFYRSYRADQQIPRPVLTPEQAKQKLSPNLKVTDEGLALIRNRDREEVLTYRFKTSDDPRLTIFINAITGQEEMILTPDGGQY